MEQFGRYEIYTDVEAVTYENVISVLQKAYSTHQLNIASITTLLNYDAGIQPIQRQGNKAYRSDIDYECVDNVANEVSTFKLGYIWGNPITLVQRGLKDSGSENESRAIALVNEGYEAEGIRTKTQALGRYVEITGIGYTFVDINMNYEEGDSFFDLEVLDPRNTFVVRSSRYLDRRKMLGVTFRVDAQGNRYFTCYTKDRRFEILDMKILNGEEVKSESWNHDLKSGELNPLGMIPIVEWIRSYDRMGCFEHQLSEMDNLNILNSNLTNDVEQNTQAFFHTNDVDFPTQIVTNEDGTTTEEVQKPKEGSWLRTYTSPDGKTPFIKPLILDYNYDGILNNMVSKRALILQKCNVPQRNDNSGGSTGVAMDSATGWAAAESAACTEQSIMESCKMEEVKLVIKAIKTNPYVPSDSPLLNLRYVDIEPSIKRNKTYELTTKVNFFATAVSHGIYGLHALKAMNAFEDANQVWEDSKELITKFQESQFRIEENTDEKRLSADESDQISNSPMIDGLSVGNE